MPRGDKSKYTDKQERKADHIAQSYEERGVSEEEAERRAWATVNKDDGGGKKPEALAAANPQATRLPGRAVPVVVRPLLRGPPPAVRLQPKKALPHASGVLPEAHIVEKLQMADEPTWVVVADGSQARILSYFRRSHDLKPVENGAFFDERLKTSEIVTDKQPRVQESVGAARHGVEPRTDPHQQREDEFIDRLAKHLEDRRSRDEFGQLVVIAPAKAMGVFRKQCPAGLKKHIIAEIVRDYAHQSDDYIYGKIKDKLPV